MTFLSKLDSSFKRAACNIGLKSRSRIDSLLDAREKLKLKLKITFVRESIMFLIFRARSREIQIANDFFPIRKGISTRSNHSDGVFVAMYECTTIFLFLVTILTIEASRSEAKTTEGFSLSIIRIIPTKFLIISRRYGAISNSNNHPKFIFSN